MADGLSVSAAGRPYANCPKCGRIHAIMRRKDYLERPVLQFRCGFCGTTWRASDEERAKIAEYYATARTVGRPRAPGNSPDAPKEPAAKHDRPRQTDPPVKKEPAKRKDIWSKIGL